MSHPQLAIVIVNYRTAGLTIDCLRSLEPQALSIGAKVFVTDNLSGDDSIQRISTAIAENGWSNWATLMPLERNGGFAYGNNAAIKVLLQSDVRPDYILLLNPDTLARDEAVAALLDFMEKHPHIGIAGSRLEDPDGTPQRSAFRFHTIASEFEGGVRLSLVSRLLKNKLVAPPVSDEACPTQWLAGASMMVRRQVFEQIGLLDEAYFMYFEEVDFCLRSARAGWQCWYVPTSRVVHLVGQASGVTDPRLRKRRPDYWFESRRRYFIKNHGALRAMLADAAWAVGFSLWRVRRFLQRRPDNDPPKLLADFVRHSVFVRGFAA
ncbi:MAG: glycosyltransferase family 2 protein [Phycisphaerales bacterium]|jgi:GT2 family glycosyltransferase|nr:glycosyltransferase family 2 protein [Phycisphaerales bacterium]